VHIEDETGKTLGELSEFLGKQTNNYAEYSGLLAALEFALREGHPRLRVVADSELMVKQIKGQYRVNSPDLRPLYDEAKRRIARLEKFRIEHVLRGKNKNADRLANLAMDRGIKDRGTKDQGMTRSPGAFRAAVQASSEPSAAATAVAKRALRGVVRGGVIQFVAGELPEGTLVEITPERS
jgi:probable phosphoglycerate mutase